MYLSADTPRCAQSVHLLRQLDTRFRAEQSDKEGYLQTYVTAADFERTYKQV